MELANIEKLLEAYFEGATSEQEEQELRAFFKTEEIPSHLAMYKAMFEGYEAASKETSQSTIALTQPKKNNRFWNLSIAATLLITIGLVGYTFTQSGYTAEEKEALAAFQKTQEVMFLLSENLNEGTASIGHLDEFTKGIANMSVLNQFNESKNLILK